MKTAKQLQRIYIQLSMDTLSESEYKKEIERLRYILGAHPKPKRNETQTKYYDFVRSNIYLNNTTFAWLNTISKGKIKDLTNDSLIKFFGSYEAAKFQMEKIHKETNRRIESYFEKYRVELNEILDN